jgi:4-hydroxy-3-polyprenylbenzoate decarboxylase
MDRYLLCMTGASGAIYGIRLMAAISRAPGTELHLVASSWAERVVSEETGLPLSEHIARLGSSRIVRHAPDDLAAAVSSGSFRLTATVIAPCSIATAGAIAAGVVQNLVHRAGAVALKEGWPLVLVPRESPLSLVALRVLVSLKEAGAVILPASPGFYARPATIDDLVDHVVARICDTIGIEVPDAHRWKEEGEE